MSSPDDFVSKFNTTIMNLLRILEKKSTTELDRANLDLLRKRIRTLVDVSGRDDILLEHAAPILVGYRDQIRARDESFFTSMDFRAEYAKHLAASGRAMDSATEFVFGLTDSIKEKYIGLSQSEKDEVYLMIRDLLRGSAKYLLRQHESKA